MKTSVTNFIDNIRISNKINIQFKQLLYGRTDVQEVYFCHINIYVHVHKYIQINFNFNVRKNLMKSWPGFNGPWVSFLDYICRWVLGSIEKSARVGNLIGQSPFLLAITLYLYTYLFPALLYVPQPSLSSALFYLFRCIPLGLPATVIQKHTRPPFSF